MGKEKMQMKNHHFPNQHRWVLLVGMSFLLWSNLAGAKDFVEVAS